MRVLPLLALAVTSTATAQKRDWLPVSSDSLIRQEARQETPALWRIPLGTALVEEMRWLAPGRLLVGLRKDFPTLPNLDYLLVDTDSGRVIWRYTRSRAQATYAPLIAGNRQVLFRLSERNKAALAGVDDATGAERWTREFTGADVRFHVLAGATAILAEQPDKKGANLSAVDASDGRVLWTRQIRVPDEADIAAGPLYVGDGLYQMYLGVERLSPADGRALWTRSDLRIGRRSPPAQIDRGELLLVDSTGTLVALDTATGATRWRVTLGLPGRPSFGNVFPDGDWIFVRAMLDAATGVATNAATGGGMHPIVAVRRDGAAARLAWTYFGVEPTVSNFLRAGGHLLVGTPTSLFALDTARGTADYSAMVSTTGRLYPVNLRRFGDTVVYVSELVVASFNARTGRQLYSHGFSPVSNETNLSGLDAAIPRLKETVASLRNQPNAGAAAGSLGAFASREAQQYQNMANSYYWQGRDAFQRRDYLSAEFYNSQEQRASSQARFQTTLALAASAVSVVASFVQAMRTARIAERLETAIERQELFRQAILTAYARGAVGDYIIRPNRRFLSMSNDFTTVTVIHLPSGRRRETIVSPTYMSYGLWNVPDFERGLVFHHGIGMDPAQYSFSEYRKMYPYGEIRSIDSFLIAAPLRMPPAQ